LKNKFLNQFMALLIRELKLKTVFKAYFTLSIIDSVLNALLIFLLIGLGGKSTEGYVSSYFEFILTGIIVQKFLNTCISSPYHAIYSYYMKGLIDIIYLESTNVIILLLPRAFLGLIMGFFDLFLIFSIALLFNIEILYMLSSLLLLLLFFGIIACMGIGLMAASMLYLADARTGSNPVIWIFNLFSTIISGAYYPLEKLPFSIQILGLILPHTYVLDLVRRFSGIIDFAKPYLLIHFHVILSPVLCDFLFLALLCVAYIFLGIILMKISLSRARQEGRISRWI